MIHLPSSPLTIATDSYFISSLFNKLLSGEIIYDYLRYFFPAQYLWLSIKGIFRILTVFLFILLLYSFISYVKTQIAVYKRYTKNLIVPKTITLINFFSFSCRVHNHTKHLRLAKTVQTSRVQLLVQLFEENALRFNNEIGNLNKSTAILYSSQKYTKCIPFSIDK